MEGAALGRIVEIPAFTFRVAAEDVTRYRAALGVSGDRVPFGMALRALTSEAVLAAVAEVAPGRHPVHVSQAFRSESPLRAGVEYVCHVRLQTFAGDRLRIEQRLIDSSGRSCLTLAADIALVVP